MRIIAGEFRGRKLLPPLGQVTRPITDRVKQSLFDILAPLIPNAVVYDLFAGTGSMGLECLSRGAQRAEFFEMDRSAAARLKQNIQTLGVLDRAQIVVGDLFEGFAKPAAGPPARARLVFLDPPYRFVRERADDLRTLAGSLSQQLDPNGIVVFRHDSGDELTLPPLEASDRREYGGMTIEFLRPAR